MRVARIVVEQTLHTHVLLKYLQGLVAILVVVIQGVESSTAGPQDVGRNQGDIKGFQH